MGQGCSSEENSLCALEKTYDGANVLGSMCSNAESKDYIQSVGAPSEIKKHQGIQDRSILMPRRKPRSRGQYLCE